MMLDKVHTRHIEGVVFNILLVGVTLLIFCGQRHMTKADEVPAFFLKIAKNPTLPRIGRSGLERENFFYKADKHIPRIGRYSHQPSDFSLSPLQNEQENYSSLTKRRIDPLKVERWQNFPLAIEGPRELWQTLAGYSRDGNDDIDNEIWQRKKRTGTGALTTN